MVFVNLDKKPSRKAAGSSPYGKVFKCMNCGTVIDQPIGGIYGRRFCSTRCQNEYLGKN